jgi:hypothetical protein
VGNSPRRVGNDHRGRAIAHGEQVPLKNGATQALVLYWYQGRGRIVASEYAVKWNLLRDAALKGHTEEALVRIVDYIPRAGQLNPAGARAGVRRREKLGKEVGTKLLTDVCARAARTRCATTASRLLADLCGVVRRADASAPSPAHTAREQVEHLLRLILRSNRPSRPIGCGRSPFTNWA